MKICLKTRWKNWENTKSKVKLTGAVWELFTSGMILLSIARSPLKVALADSLNDAESGERYRKMFFNEAHTAGSLTHPNIVSIFDAGVDEDTCYIVMEYIEGG